MRNKLAPIILDYGKARLRSGDDHRRGLLLGKLIDVYFFEFRWFGLGEYIPVIVLEGSLDKALPTYFLSLPDQANKGGK